MYEDIPILRQESAEIIVEIIEGWSLKITHAKAHTTSESFFLLDLEILNTVKRIPRDIKV